jgi:putative transposase
LAHASEGFATLAYLLLLLHDLEERGAMAEDPQSTARQGSGKARKKKAPTAAIIDSQSVKSANHPGSRGYDAGKRILGRKRHLLVDTLGLILLARVHPADIQDRDGARMLLTHLEEQFGWIKLIWADGGYAGALKDWVRGLARHRPIDLQIVKRSDDVKGFKVLRKRWIVERTFGWFTQSRRLNKDYETSTESAEAFIYIAMTRIMIRRIA